MRSQKILIAFAATTAVILIFFAFSLSRTSSEKQTTLVISQDDNPEEAFKAAQENVTKQSGEWPTYTDPVLGISFKYPSRDLDGKLEIFRVQDILFVVPETSAVYKMRETLNLATSDKILTQAKKLDNSGYWAITVQDVTSDSDFQKIIDKKFSYLKNGCKFAGIQKIDGSDVYRVGVAPVDGNPDADGSCWINYRLAFLYSPHFKRTAIWDMGQDYFFYLSTSTNDAADLVMFNSFKFGPVSN